MFIDELRIVANKFGVEFSEEQLLKFNCFYDLVVEWNKKINLTAITEPKDFAIKHIIDSISVWNEDKFIGIDKIVDVGTGAGFPGIPLKIYKPNKKFVLIDSLNKRVKFLETVIDKIGLDDISVIHSRAEEAANRPELRSNFDLSLSRAVAKLNVLAEYCLPFVKVGGYFAALKGPDVSGELIAARNSIKLLGGGDVECVNIKLPNEDKRNLIYIKKNVPTPKKFPRKAGTPEKNPLN